MTCAADAGTCRRRYNDYLVPFPFSPASAAAKWDACTPALTPYPVPDVRTPGCSPPQYTVTPEQAATYGSLHRPAAGVTGGITQEHPSTCAPYYDPRSQTQRAPHVAAALCGADVLEAGYVETGVPFLPHGPSAFTHEPVKPKTQFAPHGPIAIQPLVADVHPGSCVCCLSSTCAGVTEGNGNSMGCTFSPYSLTAVLLVPRNLLHVRNLLERASLVVVTDRLRNAHISGGPEACGPCIAQCACNIIGQSVLAASFVEFATQYRDVSKGALQSMVATVLSLDETWVSLQLGYVRNTVLSAARANYARAEGPRAYLQDNPVIEADVPVPERQQLPLVLPGTGCRTTPLDNALEARALTDPRSSAPYRKMLSLQSGVNIGCSPLFAVGKTTEGLA